MNGITLEQARAAQSKLLESTSVPLSGVGITRTREGFGLKVNVSLPEYRSAVPSVVDSVPVCSVEVVGRIVACS